jgi:hypothetical protein
MTSPFAAEGLAGETAADLRVRLETLRARLEDFEAQSKLYATRNRVASAQAVTAGAVPGMWKLPGTETSIGFSGFVKVDAFYTIGRPHASPGGAAGNPGGQPVGDEFILSSIPVDGSVGAGQGSDFRMHARQSRIRFESRTPTDWGLFQTRIESDFFFTAGNERFSNSDLMRVREAWGALGPVLGGQRQSTFMDADTFAEMVDNFGPAGDSNVRQAQIRYSYQPRSDIGLDLAIENPETMLATPNPALRNTNFVDRAPDMIARLRHRASWGAINLSGVLRRFEYDDGRGDHDSLWGGGGHLGSTINLWGKDTFKFAVNYGPGLGRYVRTAVGGSPELNVTCATDPAATFVPGCGAVATLNTVFGGWGQLTHWWTNTLHSNLIFGYMEAEVDVARLGAGANGLNRNIQSVAANLFWNPVSRVNIGLEFSHGWRYLARAAPGSQMSGEASRIQLGMQYHF